MPNITLIIFKNTLFCCLKKQNPIKTINMVALKQTAILSHSRTAIGFRWTIILPRLENICVLSTSPSHMSNFIHLPFGTYVAESLTSSCLYSALPM
ncbi:hypothetical protein XENTR_v10020970 [Xenopus tropicalis]|nr:hypothetical protein XENTR_v10020970 [Xenopus tropicalis]